MIIFLMLYQKFKIIHDLKKLTKRENIEKVAEERFKESTQIEMQIVH